MRRRALLVFSLPLGVAACLAGHTAGYALAGSPHRDAQLHGYLAFAPQALALGAALLVLGVALRAAGRLHGSLAAWPFALLPPLAFLTQETIERIAGGAPLHDLLTLPVYAGLAAQVPLVLAAYLVARALVDAADATGLALAARRVVAPAAQALPLAAVPVIVARPAAFDRRGRAPPSR